MAEPFIQYPEAFPIDAVAFFSPVLRGKLPDDLNMAINAGQILQLWACGQTFPVDDATVLSTRTESEVANWLDAQAAGAPVVQGWETIIPVLLPYLLDGLKRLIEERRKRRG